LVQRRVDVLVTREDRPAGEPEKMNLVVDRQTAEQPREAHLPSVFGRERPVCTQDHDLATIEDAVARGPGLGVHHEWSRSEGVDHASPSDLLRSPLPVRSHRRGEALDLQEPAHGARDPVRVRSNDEGVVAILNEFERAPAVVASDHRFS
jgi:hypothetical protein